MPAVPAPKLRAVERFRRFLALAAPATLALGSAVGGLTAATTTAAGAAPAAGAVLFASTTGSGTTCGPADPCDLQTAIDESSGDTVDLYAGTYFGSFTDGTSVALQPAPGATAVLDGDGLLVLSVAGGVTSSVSGLTLTDANTFSSGGCISNAGTLTVENTIIDNCLASDGGGIFNTGNLVVDSSTLENDSALGSEGGGGGAGGGIFNAGTLTMTGSRLLGDSTTSSGEGGGLFNVDGATASIDNSTLQGDSAGQGGGAENFSFGTLSIDNSTFASDTAQGPAGGLYVASNSTTTVLDSTFADDASGGGQPGGAVFDAGQTTTTIASSTFFDNSASSGLGAAVATTGVANLAADILAGPASQGTECSGGINDLGYNVDNDASCAFSVTGSVSGSTAIDSYLGPLSANGGPTQTVPLTASTASAPPDPALGAIPGGFGVTLPDGTSNFPCSTSDQRGVARPASGCDMGAFELTAVTSVTITTSAPIAAPGDEVTYTATVLPVPAGGSVTFFDGGAAQDQASQQCGDQPVTAGVATCTVDYSSPGTYDVTATYNGFAGFAPSSTTGTLIEHVAAAVLYASPSAGGTLCVRTAPCTLDTALAEASPGSAVDLFGGTYFGNFDDATSVTIQPVPGVANPMLDGGGEGTVLTVDAGVRSIVRGVTITDGTAFSLGTALPLGSGVRSVVGSVQGQGGCGGGILNSGNLTVEDATITNNSSTSAGGAICNLAAATLALGKSEVDSSSAGVGGGIFNQGTAVVEDSTIALNTATGAGGGIFNMAALTVEGSTLSGNSAGSAGGAIFNEGADGSSGGTVDLATTILATPGGAPSGGECAGTGTYRDDGYNIDDDGTCQLSATGSTSGSSVIGDYLGSLDFWGGPTPTIPLLPVPSSPTTAADPALAVVPGTFVLPDGSTSCQGTDQRGTARQIPCDIGAFELRQTEVVITTSSPSVARGGEVTYTATVSPAPDGGSVNFSDGSAPQDAASSSCGDMTVTAGIATCTVSYGSPGPYTVTATYSGDTDFASSVSSSLSERVVASVLYASPSALDTATECVRVAPCTLTTALAEASGGSAIYLFGGTYTGNFVDTVSVTVQPVPGSTVAPTLDAGGEGTVLTVDPGVSTLVDGVIISDGTAFGKGGVGSPPAITGAGQVREGFACGGGIANDGTLVVEHTTVTSDSSDFAGGGICNFPDGTLSLVDSEVDSSSATFGGGILNDGGTLLVKDSTIADNSATDEGGGLYNIGTATIEGSTLSADTAANGGGAIFNFANPASPVQSSSGTVYLATTLLATPGGAPAGGECAGAGTYVDSGYNIDDDATCQLGSTGSTSGSAVIGDYLGSLDSFGGPTPTVPLLAVPSPATTSADPALAVVPGNFVLPDGSTACQGTDQRGTARQIACDIGAFELRLTEVVVTTSDAIVAPNTTVTYTATVTPAPDGGTVSFSDGTLAQDAATKHCSSQTLVAGVATCVVSYNSPGTYSVTAAFSGNTDFAAASGNALTEHVVQSVLSASPTGTGTVCATFEPCPLTTALLEAAAGNTIELAGGTYTGNFDDPVSVTIEPVPGVSTPVLDASGDGTVLSLGEGVASTVRGVTISDGSNDVAGGIYVNAGHLTLVGATVSGNSAGEGGAIYNGSGTVVVERSTITGNSATDEGGAIFNSGGTLLVDDSTIAGNSASLGGAIYTSGTATVERSTLSADTAESGNEVASGESGQVVLAATILAEAGGPPASTECEGTQLDAGYNVADDGSCHLSAANHSVASSTAIGHYLSALGGFGGPTSTVALLPAPTAGTALGDPALTAVAAGFVLPDGATACQGTDQRGVARQSTCDVGAFELRRTALVLSSSAATVGAGGQVTFTALVIPAPDGGTVAFADGAGNPATKACAAQPVFGGLATCTVSYGVPGLYGVTASYSGDTDDSAAVSGGSALVVARSPTATSLAVSTTTPAPGTKVVLTATVRPAPNGGAVAFLDDSKPIAGCGAVPVLGGMARCSAALPPGPHSVVAAYGGTTAFEPSVSPPVSITVAVPTIGYWLADATGDVFSFGNAGFHGSLAHERLPAPIVAMAATPDGAGYWLVDSKGDLYAFGDAKLHGSLAGKAISSPIVAMAAAPDGGGYWFVAANGAVYSFGDAHFHGSMVGTRLRAPIVGMASSADGGGYWLVASDGGVFTFGDARFLGSMVGVPLTQSIVAMAATPDGRGYWLAGGDGGVFTFGDAHFHGSMGRAVLNSAVTGLAVDGATGGYWLVTAHGSVFGFNAPFQGELGDLAPTSKDVAIVAD